MLEIEKTPHLGLAIPRENWIPAPRYALRRHRVLELLGAGQGQLLDIGCGPGSMLPDYAESGWQAQGLEISPSALKVAERLHKGTKQKVNSKPDTSWKNHFDVIIAMEVLEHIENPDAALKLWLSWLKPGGRLILSVPAHPSLWSLSDVKVGHYRRYTWSDLMALARENAIDIEKLVYFGFPLATLIEIARFWKSMTIVRKLIGKPPVRSRTNNELHLSMQSGTDREGMVKFWPLMKSYPYRIFFGLCVFLQRLPYLERLGNGIILCAVKPATLTGT